MTDNMTDDTLLLEDETETADANPADRKPRKQVTRDESSDTESAFDRLMRSLRADLEQEDVDETDNLLIEWDDVDDPFHDINDDDIEASLSNLNLAIDMDDRTLKQAPPFSNLHDEIQDTILRNRAEQGEALSLNPLGIEKPNHHLNQIGHMLQSGQVQIRRTAIGALPLILPEPAGTSAGLSNLYDAAALSTPRGKLQTKPSAQAISKALLEEQPPIALPDIEVIAEPEIEAEIEAVVEAEAESPVVIEAEVEPTEASITDEFEVEAETAEAAETVEQAQQPSWMIPPADMAEQVQAEPVEEPVEEISEEAVREEIESADEAVAEPPVAPKLNLKPAVDPVETLQPSAKELRRQEKQKAKELAREQAERRKEEKQAEKLAALQAKAEAKQAKADAVARVRAAKAANANNRSAPAAATPAQKSSKAGPIAVAACLTLMVGAGVTLIVFNEHPQVRKLAEQLNALRPAPKPASTAPDSSAAQIPNLNMATTAPTPDAVVATEPPPIDAEELAALAEQPPAIPAAPAVAEAPATPAAPVAETAEEEPPVPAEETQVAAIPTVNAAEAPAATEAKPQRLTAPAPIPLPAELEALRESAVAGNRQAQHDLGAHFAAGRLVTQDFARAAYWFQEAAIRGVANAQYNFGVLLQQGLGVDPNPELAVQWYRRAAENGHVEAQYNMGVAYADGIGTQRDIAQAVRWFEQSAAAGIARAAFNLGVMYEVGMLGSRDIDAARQWYRQAATSGDQDAIKAIDRLNSQSN